MSNDSALEDTDEGFFRAMQEQDVLGLVIRAQIYIEYHVEQLLDLAFIDPGYQRQAKFSYYQKVCLVLAMGLDEGLGRPLFDLGKLRNDFAHKLDTKLSRERESQFLSTFSERERDVATSSLRTTWRAMYPSASKEFADLETPDRFTLLIVVLRAALRFAEQEFRHP